VEVVFASRKLAAACTSRKEAQKQYGAVRAKRLAVRLQQLRVADSVADLFEVTGRCHELTGDLAGQYALDLDGPYRLLFTPLAPDGTRQTTGDRGSATAVVVERIHNYH